MDDSSWRPQQHHRAVARKLLLSQSLQIKTMLKLPGIHHFFFTEEGTLAEVDRWRDENVDTWPCLGLCNDNGSDQVCANNALLYKYDCNSFRTYDGSHMNIRSFDAALKLCNLYSFWMLYMMSKNLEYGPYQDAPRRHDLATVMQRVYSTKKPHEVPLFLGAAPRIARALERVGIHMLGERSQDLELWEWMSRRPRKPDSPRRVSNCRYGASLHAAQENHPYLVDTTL